MNKLIQCLDIGDHRIEVIGLENCLHMGQVRTGLKASARRLGKKIAIRLKVSIFILNHLLLYPRLAQCSEIILETKKTFPMQIDGEPWMQAPAVVRLSPLVLSFFPRFKSFLSFL